METADNDSRRLRHETEDFLDQRLGSFEILLDKLSQDRRRRSPEAVDRRSPVRTPSRPTTTTTRPRASSTRTDDRVVAATRALRINAGELLRQPGTHRRVELSIPPDDLDLGDGRGSSATSIVAVDLESTIDGIVVGGTASVAVVGRVPALPADRSTASPSPTSTSSTRTIVTDPDAFPIEGEQLDLAPMVRELVLLELPDAPLCRDDCAGICADVRPSTATSSRCDCDDTVRDERWAALDQLDLD